jgi:hypothetical protein
MALLLRKPIHLKITLRSDPEGIRNPIEESEHRGDVNRFSDLGLRPTVIAQRLHVLIGGAIRCLRHPGHVVEERAFCRAQTRGFQIAIRDGPYSFFFCSLNTQEVCMRVQSIWTAIEPGYPARDRFLGFAVKMAFRKMNRVAEFHHFAQKVGAMAEAFQNTRHLLAARFCTPFVIDLGDLAGRIAIFYKLDFGLVVRHFFCTSHCEVEAI